MRGFVADSPVFPWFRTGTPATDEFAAAFGKYGKNVTLGVGPPTGWVAAKVLEKAGKNIPEPPTAAAILEGLWTFRNESIGGITQPLTFIRDKTAKPLACWFNIQVSEEGGEWVSPDNFEQHCE